MTCLGLSDYRGVGDTMGNGEEGGGDSQCIVLCIDLVGLGNQGMCL